METITTGMNRTSAVLDPDGCQAVVEAVPGQSPDLPLNTSAAARERLLYLQKADAVGSVPSRRP